MCPNETRSFTCKTRGSDSLAWTSDEYIGKGGAQLQFYKYSLGGTVMTSDINKNVSANLTVNRDTNGVRVLQSVLTIPISSDVPQQSITCINRGLSTEDSCIVKMAGT